MQTQTINEHVPASAAERTVGDFDLVGHLAKTGSADKAAWHIRIGLENWIATKFMQGALRMPGKVPPGYEPRAGQYKQIERESHSLRSKRRQIVVFAKMPFMGGFMDGSVNFLDEIKNYDFLDYHNYYLQPFHSLPGGWLSPMAATGNEAAMRALFAPSTPTGAAGLREAVAAQLPSDAKVVYDFGAACGMQSKYFAERMGHDGKVVAIDPSPFGLIYGQKKNNDPRIEWKHGFAEEAKLEPNSGDLVNMFFLLHETPNHIKEKLLAKAYEVLKPGGTLLVHEPPLWDLEYRSGGFFEPYRDQWLEWDGLDFIKRAGFSDVVQEDLVDPDYVLSFHATKPR